MWNTGIRGRVGKGKGRSLPWDYPVFEEEMWNTGIRGREGMFATVGLASIRGADGGVGKGEGGRGHS